jgi:hypothetical protein
LPRARRYRRDLVVPLQGDVSLLAAAGWRRAGARLALLADSTTADENSVATTNVIFPNILAVMEFPPSPLRLFSRVI